MPFYSITDPRYLSEIAASQKIEFRWHLLPPFFENEFGTQIERNRTM
jgi:hypothetical protein